jgi:hypothetical protein
MTDQPTLLKGIQAETPPAKAVILTPDECEALERAIAGQPLRQVEIDRLVSRGCGSRDSDGQFHVRSDPPV